MADYSEKNYIMWLSSVMGIPVDVRRSLIEHFGSAEEVWRAKAKDIVNSKILSENRADMLIYSRGAYNMDGELDKLCRLGADFIVPGDSVYPVQLTAMHEAPLGLYMLGNMPTDTMPMVSIVGSRRVSDYGAMVCSKIAGELAHYGITVVSGMAMGIDAIAHKGAIDAGGKTIAVLGTGIDVCYPPVNRNLYNEIKAMGCLLSEFPFGTAPNKFNFPYRNRIIAGLSRVTVVVEAAEKSGSLITAESAIENSRTVMAVPGNITSALSRGCNELIRNGCAPVTCTEDILEALDIKLNKKELKNSEKILIPLAEDEKMLYDCIGYEPITIDELISRSDMDAKEAMCLLTMLELKGCIRRLSGQKIVRSL